MMRPWLRTMTLIAATCCATAAAQVRDTAAQDAPGSDVSRPAVRTPNVPAPSIPVADVPARAATAPSDTAPPTTPAFSTTTTTPATTSPATTAPATTVPVAIDATTPKSAVRTFAQALEVGDGVALRAVLFTADDAERRMADATIHMATALATFRYAAVAQFGKPEVDKVLADPDAKHAAALARIDAAVETVTGDTATVGQPDEPPVVLHRTTGQWQVVIGALSASDSPTVVEDRLRGIDRQAEVLDDLAGDIRVGRYRSMREVLTVLHGQMMKAALESKDLESKDPANGPTTEPTVHPPGS